MAQVDVTAELTRLFLGTNEVRRHVDFFCAIPDALVSYMAPFWWDLDKLLALDLPVRNVAMSDLDVFLAVPFWRASAHAGLFQLNACDVRADPVTHADHWARTMATDLAFPIMLYGNADHRVLLDGYHRLLKAHHLGIDALPAMLVPEAAVPGILMQSGFLSDLNRLRAHSPNLIDDLRRVAHELMASLPAGTFPEWI